MLFCERRDTHDHALRPLPADLWLQGLQAVLRRRLYLSQPGRHPGNQGLYFLLGKGQRRICRERVRGKNREGKYIAYFQSFTNTYAPVAVLEQRYREAIAPEDIVGLAVATRPDCLPEEVVALLARINRIKPVSVELGLQTVHEDTARYLRRGYPTAVYLDAVKRLKAAGLEVVTHIILGLPGETEEMMMETTRQAVAAGTDGVKFHLLHVLRGTDLEQEYLRGRVEPLSLERYGQILKACISCLPEHIIVHRITGDGAKRDLIAPAWSADKKRVLNYLYKVLDIQK